MGNIANGYDPTYQLTWNQIPTVQINWDWWYYRLSFISAGQWCKGSTHWDGLDHYSEVIISPMSSQFTSLAIVCSTVYSGADQRKQQSSASLAFVQRIHRWPVNCPHKWPVARKMLPFDDLIIDSDILSGIQIVTVGCLTVLLILSWKSSDLHDAFKSISLFKIAKLSTKSAFQTRYGEVIMGW